MKDLKALSYFFYGVVGAIGICLVMIIVTGVHQYHAKKVQEAAPLSIPLPSS